MEISGPEEYSKEPLINLNRVDISFVNAFVLDRHARRPGYQIGSISLKDIEKALNPKKKPDPATLLPDWLQGRTPNFDHVEANKLPPHRKHDHTIRLTEGKKPGFGPLYNISRDELLVLDKYIKDNTAKGFIRSSQSEAASPVLFVRKPGGGIRLCVDYRGLNAITIKNRYPLPLFKETLMRLCRAKHFSIIDIIAAFNKLRMALGEEWKTAFRTRYGLFEYLVMPFGLANAPATWQTFINDILRDKLDVFCTAYLDDILIYSNTQKEHREHVHWVLDRLQEAGIQADIEKCHFDVPEVKYCWKDRLLLLLRELVYMRVRGFL